MDKYPNVLWAGRFPERANGSALNFGRFLLGTATSYAIYINKDNPLDDLTDTEADFYDNASGLTFTYSYEPNSIYYIGVSQLNACGGLESDNAVWVAIKTDGNGNILGALVGNISWAEVIKEESGDIQVRWKYDDSYEDATGFKIYEGIGRSTVTTLKHTESFIKGKEMYSATFTPTEENGWIKIIAYSVQLESQQPYYLRFGTDDTAGGADSYSKLASS